jgi:hypothetical protein
MTKPPTGLLDWLCTVPGDFLFLLALPFIVALLGLLAFRGESHRSRGQR